MEGAVCMCDSADRQHQLRLVGIFDSLDSLADKIGELLECPVTIEDSNHQILSYSKHHEDIDDVRRATIMGRKVPDNVVSALWKKGYMTKLFDSDEPVAIPVIEKVGLSNRVAVSVRRNNEILGFIWAHTDGSTISDAKLQLLKEAVRKVKNLLLKDRSRVRAISASYRGLFWQLLTGDLEEVKDMKDQARRLGMQLDGRLSMVIMEFSEEVTETIEKHANYLAETLDDVQVVCRMFDHNQLLLLVRLPRQGDTGDYLNRYIDDFTQLISARLHIDAVHGSGGNICHSVRQIPNSYSEALHVLELKRKFPEELARINLYQELGIYQFIEDLLDMQMNSRYKNIKLERLKEYDRKNHTAMLQTLKAYLEFDSNVQQAAKHLHVHPNTLNYRLKRISEVGGIDLMSPDQKVTAYLDLKVENIRKGFDL
ncbi:PucR family transcriptional regulator [Virgibacillus xinjiangensis]|uniref:PucR family transcriptional regulator n=1 Tax=Virgibacillus xinjiangensis TaxID=393090 RepID=A0ABV7CW57_9BACI